MLTDCEIKHTASPLREARDPGGEGGRERVARGRERERGRGPTTRKREDERTQGKREGKRREEEEAGSMLSRSQRRERDLRPTTGPSLPLSSRSVCCCCAAPAPQSAPRIPHSHAVHLSIFPLYYALLRQRLQQRDPPAVAFRGKPLHPFPSPPQASHTHASREGERERERESVSRLPTLLCERPSLYERQLDC